MLMGDGGQLFRRRRRAEDVRHMRDRDELRFRREQRAIGVEIDLAVIGNIEPFQHRAFALAQQVPRDDVRMMLGDGEDDLVALRDFRCAHRVGDEVEGIRAAGGEDDLIRRARVEE